jgi:anti-anti-sigma regulatory factor
VNSLVVADQAIGTGVARLYVRGEIDMATVAVLEQAMHQALTDGEVVEVRVDLADANFCDSAGVAAPDRAYRQASVVWPSK